MLGEKRRIYMYHWIEDREFLKDVKFFCSDVVNRLVQLINKEDVIQVRMYLVGSGAKDLILQNSDEPIDLDYNLEVVKCQKFEINDCNKIKFYVQNKLNEILNSVGSEDCQDSSSVLSTHKFRLSKGKGKKHADTKISIDICITNIGSNGKLRRLIHGKHGMIQYDTFIWNEARDSDGIEKRVSWLKNNNHWGEVRNRYLDKKNMYLARNDHDHPSYIVYIETINEIYYGYIPR